MRTAVKKILVTSVTIVVEICIITMYNVFGENWARRASIYDRAVCYFPISQSPLSEVFVFTLCVCTRIRGNAKYI